MPSSSVVITPLKGDQPIPQLPKVFTKSPEQTSIVQFATKQSGDKKRRLSQEEKPPDQKVRKQDNGMDTDNNIEATDTEMRSETIASDRNVSSIQSNTIDATINENGKPPSKPFHKPSSPKVINLDSSLQTFSFRVEVEEAYEEEITQTQNQTISI